MRVLSPVLAPAERVSVRSMVMTGEKSSTKSSAHL